MNTSKTLYHWITAPLIALGLAFCLSACKVEPNPGTDTGNPESKPSNGGQMGPARSFAMEIGNSICLKIYVCFGTLAVQDCYQQVFTQSSFSGVFQNVSRQTLSDISNDEFGGAIKLNLVNARSCLDQTMRLACNSNEVIHAYNMSFPSDVSRAKAMIENLATCQSAYQ